MLYFCRWTLAKRLSTGFPSCYGPGQSRARPLLAPAPSHRSPLFAMASDRDPRDMPAAPAAANATVAVRGRAGRRGGRGANRPRIDIDDQIAEANRLSSVVKNWLMQQRWRRRTVSG